MAESESLSSTPPPPCLSLWINNSELKRNCSCTNGKSLNSLPELVSCRQPQWSTSFVLKVAFSKSILITQQVSARQPGGDGETAWSASQCILSPRKQTCCHPGDRSCCLSTRCYTEYNKQGQHQSHLVTCKQSNLSFLKNLWTNAADISWVFDHLSESHSHLFLSK